MADTTQINLGDYIERFMATYAAREMKENSPVWSQFLRFIECDAYGDNSYKTRHAVSESLGINTRTYNDWANGAIGERGVTRSILEELTSKFKLSPTQERDLWTLAKGDITKGPVNNIALANIQHDANIADVRITSLPKRRTAIWNALQERCGYTDAKLADLSGYSAEGIRQLREGTKSFAYPRDARRVTAAFAPDNNRLQEYLTIQLLGLPKKFSPEEIAEGIISHPESKYRILTINRLQHVHTLEDAAQEIGCNTRSYTNWETDNIHISQKNTAKAITQYIGIDEQHPLFTPLMEELTGVKTVHYSSSFIHQPDGLEKMREAAGLSKTDLGKILHLDRSHITRIETGKAQIQVGHAASMIRALNIPPADICPFIETHVTSATNVDRVRLCDELGVEPEFQRPARSHAATVRKPAASPADRPKRPAAAPAERPRKTNGVRDNSLLSTVLESSELTTVVRRFENLLEDEDLDHIARELGFKISAERLDALAYGAIPTVGETNTIGHYFDDETLLRAAPDSGRMR